MLWTLCEKTDEGEAESIISILFFLAFSQLAFSAQKLGIFRFLFLLHFVIIFYSLSFRPHPAPPLFLIVLHNGVKTHSREKGVISDVVSERRIPPKNIRKLPVF